MFPFEYLTATNLPLFLNCSLPAGVQHAKSGSMHNSVTNILTSDIPFIFLLKMWNTL